MANRIKGTPEDHGGNNDNLYCYDTLINLSHYALLFKFILGIFSITPSKVREVLQDTRNSSLPNV